MKLKLKTAMLMIILSGIIFVAPLPVWILYDTIFAGDVYDLEFCSVDVLDVIRRHKLGDPQYLLVKDMLLAAIRESLISLLAGTTIIILSCLGLRTHENKIKKYKNENSDNIDNKIKLDNVISFSSSIITIAISVIMITVGIFEIIAMCIR